MIKPQPNSGLTGRTLPSILDEACEKYPNEQAFADVRNGRWTALSNHAFRSRADELAAGFLEIDAVHGDRVALLMHSNVDFMLVDMACALAGLVTTPIYLESSDDVKEEIFRSAEPRAVVLVDYALYRDLEDLLAEVGTVKTVVFVEEAPNGSAEQPASDHQDSWQFTSLDRLAAAGRRALDEDSELPERLRGEISPSRVFTIIYTSGTTGRPKGVMLTHENMTFDALAAYAGLKELGRGDEETMLSFLPMTHAFARVLNYGAMNYGFSLRFTDPDSLSDHLKETRPTIMGTVPRVLERLYEAILERGEKLTGFQKKLFSHALKLAESDGDAGPQDLVSRLDAKITDLLVFRKWRAGLGGRLRFIISGGAALEPSLNRVLATAGLTVLQGYGLTEASPVVSFNRPEDNRPETVGQALAGVEVRIADDDEILTRGPHVMEGYYRNPEATREAIDNEGWLHTEDLGRLSRDGFLIVTGRKTSTFKLSTGKFVVPHPIESALTRNPLVDYAILIGEEHKYCVALLFVNPEAIRNLASKLGLDANADLKTLRDEESFMQSFQDLVDEANRGLSHWEQVQRFRLIDEAPSIRNGLLTPTLKLRRPMVAERFDEEIEALYDRDAEEQGAEQPPEADKEPAAATARADEN